MSSTRYAPHSQGGTALCVCVLVLFTTASGTVGLWPRSVPAATGGTDRLATINTTISNYCPSNILHCANSRRSFFEAPREPAGYSLFKLAPRARQRRSRKIGPYEDLCCLIPYSSLSLSLWVDGDDDGDEEDAFRNKNGRLTF